MDPAVKHGTSRRRFLAASSALAPGLLVGCDALSTGPAGVDTDRGRSRDKGEREAPMLADRVRAGELPALAKRLPDDPPVVELLERTGTYGGDWKYSITGTAEYTQLVRTIGHEFLMRWDAAWTESLPNVAESIETLDDGGEYIIHLRPGMKWSDGAPFTAADIVFVYDDIFIDPDLGAAEEWLMLADQPPPEFEQVDDHTVRVRFAEPHGLFVEHLATSNSRDMTFRPRHYLEKFHQKYNPNVEADAKAEGFDSWIDFFNAKAEEWFNPDLPTLNPWFVTNALGDGTRVVAERNPYYWKVDPDGRQLPYVDRVTIDLIPQDEVILLKATQGEFHTVFFGVGTLKNKPIFAESRESGGYHFVDLLPAGNNNMMIALNLNHEDPKLAEVFRNRDFRIGLSHAIDRDELIDVVYQRQGEPWQGAPRRESEELFDEEFAKQFTEYDVELANEYLDRSGLVQRDGDGFRLRSDGERLRFQVEVNTESLDHVDVMEIIRGYWREVGVDVSVKAEDRTLLWERGNANQHDAIVWGGAGGLTFDAYFSPYWYLPMYGEGARYAVAWSNWFTGADGVSEEPPEQTKRQMELYRQFLATSDPDSRAAMFREILQLAKEEFYAIGTVLPTDAYAIVKDELHNVPGEMPSAWQYPTPGPTHPEQYFIE